MMKVLFERGFPFLFCIDLGTEKDPSTSQNPETDRVCHSNASKKKNIYSSQQ